MTNAITALLRGLFLRCPNCGKGEMFQGLFKMNETCPHCGARYERMQGESVGGMAINLITAESISTFGFFAIHILFNPPFWPHFAFWIAFNILFVIFFYRHARALWVAISFLTGGVYRDIDGKYRGNMDATQPTQKQ
jgi:uncharacterized protein (DUF983 family)